LVNDFSQCCRSLGGGKGLKSLPVRNVLFAVCLQTEWWQKLPFGIANCFRSNNLEKRLTLPFDSLQAFLSFGRECAAGLQKAAAFHHRKKREV
jgi:hypothetical protein